MEQYKFKKGDSVKIKDYWKFRTESSGIPKNLMIHGGCTVDYKKEQKVIDLFDNYIIVRYTNTSGDTMQLGYEVDNLELIRSSIFQPSYWW